MALELEHMIGFSGASKSPLHVHPNGSDVIYSQGGSIVIADLRDPHKQKFLRGHDDNVTCLALSTSGRYIVSGQMGENADVIVWDFDTKTVKYRFQEHDHGVAAVELSADERFILTVGNPADSKLVVWDMLTGHIVVNKKMSAKQQHVCACWGGRKKDSKRRETTDYQLATGGPGHLTYWTLNAMEGTMVGEECSLGIQVRSFCSLAFSHDGDYIFAGSTSGDFSAVHVKHKTMHATTPAVSNGVLALVALRGDNGDRLVVGGGDGTISIFEGVRDAANNLRGLDRGPVASSTVQVDGRVTAMQLSSMIEDHAHSVEVRLLVGTDHGGFYIVSLFAGGNIAPSGAIAKCVLLQESHHAAVSGVAYPPDPTGADADASSVFATCSEDGTIRVWDVTDYKVTSKGLCQTQKTGMPTCIGFSGEVVLTGWQDGMIRAHEAEHGELLWVIDNCHRGGVSSLILSHNSKFIVSGGEQGEVRVWEIRTRDMFLHLKQHTATVTSLQLFADDTRVLSASRDRTIYAWDLHTQSRVMALTQRMGGINAIALLPDQYQVLSVGQEKRVGFWDIRQSAPVSQLDAGAEQLCITLDKDGVFFATAGVDCKVRLWRFKDGKLMCEMEGHSGAVRSVQFSPDNKQLVSTGEDGAVLVWNVFPE